MLLQAKHIYNYQHTYTYIIIHVLVHTKQIDTQPRIYMCTFIDKIQETIVVGLSPLVEDPWGLAHFHRHTFNSMMSYQGIVVCLVLTPSMSSLLYVASLTFDILNFCLEGTYGKFTNYIKQ